MVLIDIDVGQRVTLYYKENDKITYKTDEFIPEILLFGNEEQLESLYNENIPNVIYVKSKKINTVSEVLDGTAIGVKPSYFFQIASFLNKYFNYYSVKMFNVDIRLSVRYMAEKSIFPFMDNKERFSVPDISGIKILYIENKNNYLKIQNNEIYIYNYMKIEDQILEIDPDIIIFPGADEIILKIYEKARRDGKYFNLGRQKGWIELKSREYFSYGREFYKEKALIPKGRILIDPDSSFIFREGGLEGVIMTSRVSSLPASYAARATPGTLVSTLEVYEALRKGIAVPYHKYESEREKTIEQLIKADRGGIVYQPRPGIYWNVKEFDYTSMYPSIIVRKNLSIETVNKNCTKYEIVPEINYTICKDKPGFLSSALKPLLELRIKMKKMKKFENRYTGIDNALKWMLVTSFGYTGYRNAKFGSIEIHEAINAYAREYLLKAKEILEKNGFEIIHGIVDSLWVAGKGNAENIVNEINEITGLEMDFSGDYFWMKIIPEKSEISIGAPGKYIALSENGDFKVRGIMLRRGDVPDIIKDFQNDALKILNELKSEDNLEKIRISLKNIFLSYKEKIERRSVEKEKFLIEKRVNKYPWEYSLKTAEYILLENFYEKGEIKHPGEKIRYMVYSIDPIRAVEDSRIKNFDYSVQFYLKYLREAYNEILP
ncbi:MAG: type B DNA-directed DNA polymerase [Thermoplasmata archaeon]|nr:type B DNA-directed DNA polymerase [Thermoplasmata archaeon]